MTSQYCLSTPTAPDARQNCSLAELSFALYEVGERGVPFEVLANRLELPIEFVTERVEAARLCLVGVA
jgi:hypothetical protein